MEDMDDDDYRPSGEELSQRADTVTSSGHSSGQSSSVSDGESELFVVCLSFHMSSLFTRAVMEIGDGVTTAIQVEQRTAKSVVFLFMT